MALTLLVVIARALAGPLLADRPWLFVLIFAAQWAAVNVGVIWTGKVAGIWEG